MNRVQPPGLIIAAPQSGSGKTLITLALLRHLRNSGTIPAAAKVGPDYIDPAFHRRACGRTCYNLDTWAMRPQSIANLVAEAGDGVDVFVCEGVMGLFDGARGGGDMADGSTASLAALTGWPVVLVVDVSRQAASAAALIRGFVDHRKDVEIAGVVLNRVGGPGHAEILEQACAHHLPEIPVLGMFKREADLQLPERHLGLVQAEEQADLDGFLDRAAARLAAAVDVDRLKAVARPAILPSAFRPAAPLPPLGQRTAVARDEAFAFSYAAVLEGWHRRGVDISFFSPLEGNGPSPVSDSVYLPGGYPELHAGRLTTGGFLEGLRAAAARGAAVYGECGGYMVLGEALTDADGRRHEMAGLLPLETSFADRRLHIGYRRLESRTATPLGGAGARFRGHEFHYASVIREGDEKTLFSAADAEGKELPAMGCVAGPVFGSFAHLIEDSD